MIQDYINFFLTFGYFPKKAEQTIEFNDYDLNYSEYSLDELGKKASDLFVDNIQKLYNPNELNLVPLSGGLDSRAILAGLLKFTEAKNIYAFSYGAKGTLDYEIGRKVAQEIGINHISFELQNYEYTLEDLLYHSNSVKQQVFLFHNPPTIQIDILFKEFTVWSGIAGDIVGGSAVSRDFSSSIDIAIDRYLSKKIYLKEHFVKNHDVFKKFIFTGTDIDKSMLSYDEKLIFLERFEKFYKPLIENGVNKFLTPFINNEFADLMFNAPIVYRIGNSLYYNMLKNLDKSIFSLPTKNKLGLGLFANDREYFFRRLKEKTIKKLRLRNFDLGINYHDFNNKYLTQNKFKNLIDEQLDDLDKRKIIDGLDIDYIQKKYQHLQENAELIKSLVSFEIHLKNGKELPNSMDDIC
jgi:hypothetical protein